MKDAEVNWLKFQIPCKNPLMPAVLYSSRNPAQSIPKSVYSAGGLPTLLPYDERRRSKLVEMGHTKFDKVFLSTREKNYPPGWEKLKGRKDIKNNVFRFPAKIL